MRLIQKNNSKLYKGVEMKELIKQLKVTTESYTKVTLEKGVVVWS